MSINKIELQADFTSRVMISIHQMEGSKCDDEKEMMDRYMGDEVFRKQVKDLVECCMDITMKHSDEAP